MEVFLPDGYTSQTIPTNSKYSDIILLNIKKPMTVYYNMQTVFNGRQLDKDVLLKVQLYDGHKPYDLNNLKDCGFFANKPDGDGVQTIGEYKIYDSKAGLLYINVPAATFSAVGTVYCFFRVIDKNDRVMSSNTCYFQIESDFTRVAFNPGNYHSEVEQWKERVLAEMQDTSADTKKRLDTANALAKGIENSNRVLANAVDDNANAVRNGLAPTNGGANVFTAPNTFQQLLTLAGGLNIASGDFTANGTKVDFADLLKRLADVIDKVNHLFDGETIGPDVDFNNLDNGIYELYVNKQTIAKGHNFPIVDNGKDNPDVSMWGTLFQFGNSKGKYPVATQLYFNIGDATIYLRGKAGNNNGGWGEWAAWSVNK